jgi:hypothetical protein
MEVVERDDSSRVVEGVAMPDMGSIAFQRVLGRVSIRSSVSKTKPS